MLTFKAIYALDQKTATLLQGLGDAGRASSGLRECLQDLANQPTFVVSEFPGLDHEPWINGWKLFGGPDLQTLLDKGVGATFKDAKTAAEAALKKQLSQPGRH